MEALAEPLHGFIDQGLVVGVDTGPGPTGDLCQEWIIAGSGLLERSIGIGRPHAPEGKSGGEMHRIVIRLERLHHHGRRRRRLLADRRQRKECLHPLLGLALGGESGQRVHRGRGLGADFGQGDGCPVSRLGLIERFEQKGHRIVVHVGQRLERGHDDRWIDVGELLAEQRRQLLS